MTAADPLRIFALAPHLTTVRCDIDQTSATVEATVGRINSGAAMMDDFPQGVVHEASSDLQAAIRSDAKVFELWASLTPLGRNEFICWVDDAKQAKTRLRRIKRTSEELLDGKKRPCCWAGCIHRTDKAPSRWQQAVLIDQKSSVSRGR